MSVGDSSESRNYGKKKKKRSFLQNQKRFAKKGSFGRGTELSQDMYDYFINIMKVMNSKKEDEEEMRILASNIFEEIEGKEFEYCCNQIISRAVESLLPYSDDDEFCNFIQRFSENLRPIFSDPFGSHVLEQSVIVAYNKYKKHLLDKDSDIKNFKVAFFDYIIKIANYLFNNFDEFLWNTYSNAIARTVFNVLSGNPVKGEVKKALTNTKDNNDVNLPEEFSSILKKFAKRLTSFPHFNDLCNEQIQSGLMQNLIIALRNEKECSEIIEKIIGFYESNPLDMTDMDNTPFVRLLEVVLSVSSKTELKRIYKLAIKEKLVELAKSKYGNFVVQKLITHCNSKKLFGKIFAKIENEMESILEIGNSGVLLAVVKACRNLEICQGGCMMMLNKTFHIKDNKDIVPHLVSLSVDEKFNPEMTTFTLNGCLVVEEILNFRKPINVINSILEMTESNLVKLLCDTKGCHITDAFVKGSYVGEKNKDKFFKKLQGHYVKLATSKHGSRSLDAIWSTLNLTQKICLADELKVFQSDLFGNVYGKNFAWKIHLDNFRRNKEEWVNVYRSSETAEKYFADILPVKRQKTS